MQNSTITIPYTLYSAVFCCTHLGDSEGLGTQTFGRSCIILMLSQPPFCHHMHQLYRFERHFLRSIPLSCSIFLFRDTTIVSVLNLADHSVSSCPQAPSSVARCARSREQSVVRSSIYSKPGSEPILCYNERGRTIDTASRESVVRRCLGSTRQRPTRSEN